jgi:hypothetical protein
VRHTAPEGASFSCKQSAQKQVFATQKHGLLPTLYALKSFSFRETRKRACLKNHRYFESPYLLKIQKFFTY